MESLDILTFNQNQHQKDLDSRPLETIDIGQKHINCDLKKKREITNKAIILIAASLFLVINALGLRRLNPKLSGVLIFGTVMSFFVRVVLNSPSKNKCRLEKFLEKKTDSNQVATVTVLDETSSDTSSDTLSEITSDTSNSSWSDCSSE